MARQMIDKFNEYRLVSSGNAMPTGDKQTPISVKKVALRELPNEARNIITQPPVNSPPSKDSQAVSNAVKVYGTKRQQPEYPSSPSSVHLSANNASNGHLVYVRRKLDTEPGKIGSCANTEASGSPEPRKLSNNTTNEAKLLREQLQGSSSFQTITPIPVASSSTISSQGTSPPATLGKSVAGLALPEPKDSTVTTTMPVQVESPQPSASPNYWKERFLQLQTFLKNCDQASQEDYIRMLRSLSAVGRSQHAVELEKRAIHLLLEEVKELHRMRVLNVLGKALPNDRGSPSISATSPVVDFMKGDMACENPKYPWLNHG